MGVRNVKREELARLECKSLDAQFKTEILEGLNCSPFETEAVLEVVKEVYFPFLDETSPKGPPGKVTLVAVCADEPAGKSVAECEKRTVCMTVHRGPEDDRLLQDNGGYVLLEQLDREELSLAILWIQAYRSDGRGHGFPFDLPKLAYWRRCARVRQDVVQWRAHSHPGSRCRFPSGQVRTKKKKSKNLLQRASMKGTPITPPARWSAQVPLSLPP